MIDYDGQWSATSVLAMLIRSSKEVLWVVLGLIYARSICTLGTVLAPLL